MELRPGLPVQAGRARPLLWQRWRKRITRFIAGGRWTDRVSPSIRHNLRWFWIDGVFANAAESITLAYTALYVLALGATRGQIGGMSALSSLSAALLLLPGAALARQRDRRKLVCLVGGSISRLSILLAALVPLALSGSAAPLAPVAIALVIMREAFANLALPAWTSLTADIVPLQWRGRYFASRNMAMGLAGMAVTLLVGALITRAGSPAGYQLAMGLAFALGLVSTLSFARLAEPPAPLPPLAYPMLPRQPLFSHLRAHPEFLAFCATAALWNLSLNVAGPFFNIYVVEGLGGDAGVVGLLSVVVALSGLPGQRLFGPLADRWGPRRVQLLTGLLIPFMPWAWVFVREPWHIIPINLASGFLWAGYLLASFNLLLALTPEDERPRYTALYQMVVLGSLAGGAALGGAVVSRWGYQAVFALSGAGRLAAALLFARWVRSSQPIESDK